MTALLPHAHTVRAAAVVALTPLAPPRASNGAQLFRQQRALPGLVRTNLIKLVQEARAASRGLSSDEALGRAVFGIDEDDVLGIAPRPAPAPRGIGGAFAAE